MPLAEAGASCTTLWCDYVATQFDPAHLLSELGFTLVFTLVELLIWRKLIKPRIMNAIKREVHTEIDTEHGIVHHGDHDDVSEAARANPRTPCDTARSLAEASGHAPGPNTW